MLGLEEEGSVVSASTNNDDMSQLAVARNDGVATPAATRRLSTSKLLEMSRGFTSYTASTNNVDRDGKGQAAALAEFSNLFLSKEGSTLQDILVDETAKLGDAATRSALRSALVENPAAKAAARALRSAPVAPVARFPEMLEALVSATPEDERILADARELSDVVLAPRIFGGDADGD